MTDAVDFQAAIDKAAVNFDRLDQIVNGDATTVVATDTGSVPSVAKLETDLTASISTGVETSIRADLADQFAIITAQQTVADAAATASAGSATNAATSATSAAGSAALALTAGSTGNPYPNAYATTLPKGVTSGTIGGTAITGATPGTYALTAVGGSITGVQANLVVLTATTARIDIVNTGLGTGTTSPTWANPAGATLPAGTTLTAVVSTLIADQKSYWAASADGTQILQSGNNGGAWATYPFGGTQTVMYAKSGVDAAAAQAGIVTARLGSLPVADAVITVNNLTAFGTSAFNSTTTRSIAPPPIIVGTHVSVGQAIKQLGGLMVASATAVNVRLKVWRRPLASAGLNSYPGTASDDVLMDTVTATVASLSLVVGTRTLALMSLTNGVPAEDGYCYPHEFVMLDSGGATVQIGWQLCQNSATLPQSQRGWYFTTSIQNVASPSVFQWYVGYSKSVASIAAGARDGVSSNALAIATLAGGLGSIYSQADVTYTKAGTTDWTPGGLYEVAFGLDAGNELAIGRSLSKVGARIAVLDSAAANVNGLVYERPLASANIDAAPVQVDDVLVGQTGAVPLATAGITRGSASVTFSSGSTSVSVVSGTLVAGQVIYGTGFSTSGITKVTVGAGAGGTATVSRATVSAQTGVTAILSSITDVSLPLTTAVPVRSGYTYVVRYYVTNSSGTSVLIATAYASQATSPQRKYGWYKAASWTNVAAGLGLARSAVTAATIGSVAQDGLTLAQQIQASLTSSNNAKRLFRGLQNTGLRIWGVQQGRSADAITQSGDTTYLTLIETAQKGTRVRLVLCNSGSGAFTVSAASISARADTDPTDNNSGQTLVPVTFSGSASVTVAAPSDPTRRVNMVVSDWINVKTLDRTDSRKGGAYVARVVVQGSGTFNFPVMGRDTGPVFAGAVSRTDGNAVVIRQQTGAFATDATKSGFTTTTNSGASPICGVEYVARGKVVNLAWCTDSIGQGQQDTVPNDAWVGRLARAMNNPDAIAYEPSQLSWTGRSTSRAALALQDFLAVTGPDGTTLHVDAMGIMGGTVNDQGQGAVTLVSANTDVMAQNRTDLARLLAARRIVPMYYTWGPYNYSGTGPYTGAYYAASDSVRRDDNAATLLERTRGELVYDFAAALGTGGSTGDGGQLLPNMSYMSDVIHPAGAGYDYSHAQQTLVQFQAALAGA